MSIVTLGIELAKKVFALDGVDETGRAALQRATVPRGKLLEAVAALPPCLTRPNMRFVPIKSEHQQGELFVHRARQGFVQQRTATINRLRRAVAPPFD